MKVLINSILLLALAGKILASNAAAAFEALTFYYAYGLEYEAASSESDPQTSRFLGHNCSDRYGRRCTFREFLQYVYGGNGGSLGGYANDGSFDPDDTTKYPNGGTTTQSMAQMANDLADEGFVSTHFVNSQLYYGATSKDNYESMISGVADRIQYARAKIADDNAPELASARNALIGVLNERIADDFSNSIDDIKNEIKTKTGFDIVINENAQTPAGRTYSNVDWFETTKNLRTSGLSEADLNKNLDAIVAALNNYQNNRNDFHYRNIIAVESNVDRTLRPPTDAPTC